MTHPASPSPRARTRETELEKIDREITDRIVRRARRWLAQREHWVSTSTSPLESALAKRHGRRVSARPFVTEEMRSALHGVEECIAGRHSATRRGCFAHVRGIETTCTRAPAGWWCSRRADHDGPCAARPLIAERVSIAPYLTILVLLLAIAAVTGWAARGAFSLDTNPLSGFAATPRAAEIAKAAQAGPNPTSTDVAMPAPTGAAGRAATAPRGTHLTAFEGGVAEIRADAGLTGDGADSHDVGGAPINDPAHAIHTAAARYGLDPAVLERIARCESGLSVTAIGRAQELGLFQWKPTSWEQAARESGLAFPITRIFDADAQAELAAWAISHGYASWWTCAR